ncbi:MAG TPA: hypothetical protein VK427_27860, partial [Kofleriaceae bacterium]|nr:hypothetical protein [Kofleriaceae bacterium]
ASGAQPFTDCSELAAIAAPTLVVPGVDPQHPREVAEVYRAIAGATFVETTDYGRAISNWL